MGLGDSTVTHCILKPRISTQGQDTNFIDNLIDLARFSGVVFVMPHTHAIVLWRLEGSNFIIISTVSHGRKMWGKNVGERWWMSSQWPWKRQAVRVLACSTTLLVGITYRCATPPATTVHLIQVVQISNGMGVAVISKHFSHQYCLLWHCGICNPNNSHSPW